jgi:hypothetical protein
VFHALAEQLETDAVFAILYSPKELSRSLYRRLEKLKPPIAREEEDAAEPGNLFSAMVFVSRKIRLLRKLAAFAPEDLSHGLRINVRIQNIAKNLDSIRENLSRLNNKFRFLNRKKRKPPFVERLTGLMARIKGGVLSRFTSQEE